VGIGDTEIGSWHSDRRGRGSAPGAPRGRPAAPARRAAHGV